jgi:phytoene synthase
VGEDARKGRIYLPINELQQFNVTAADLLNARHSEKFEQLMAFQAARAQAAYDEAFALLPKEDRAPSGPA